MNGITAALWRAPLQARCHSDSVQTLASGGCLPRLLGFVRTAWSEHGSEQGLGSLDTNGTQFVGV